MDSVTEENVERLNQEHNDKMSELDRVKNTTIHQMWLHELELLKSQYLEYKEERKCMANDDAETEEIKPKKKTVSKSSVKKIVKKQTLTIEND